MDDRMYLVNFDHNSILKTLETSLKVKPKKIPDGLSVILPVDGYFDWRGKRMAVKIVDSLGWNGAKEMLKAWRDISAKMKIFFLLACRSAEPPAALWLEYASRKYSPYVHGDLAVLDMTSSTIYVQNHPWIINRFLERMGCKSKIYLANPKKASLRYNVYSIERERWIRAPTIPDAVTAQHELSDPRITALEAEPRPLMITTSVLGLISIVSLFGSLVLNPLYKFVATVLLVSFLTTTPLTGLLIYLSSKPVRAKLNKLLGSTNNQIGS